LRQPFGFAQQRMHVDEPVLQRLVARQRATELLALLEVVERGVKQRFHHADALRTAQRRGGVDRQ